MQPISGRVIEIDASRPTHGLPSMQKTLLTH